MDKQTHRQTDGRDMSPGHDLRANGPRTDGDVQVKAGLEMRVELMCLLVNL